MNGGAAVKNIIFLSPPRTEPQFLGPPARRLAATSKTSDFFKCRYVMKFKLRSLSNMLVEYLSVQVSDIMKTRKVLHGEWQYMQLILHAQTEFYCTGVCYTQCNITLTCVYQH